MVRDERIGERLTSGIVFTPIDGETPFSTLHAKEVSNRIKSSLNSTLSVLWRNEIAELGEPEPLTATIYSTETKNCQGITTWMSINGALCIAKAETSDDLAHIKTIFSCVKRFEGFRLTFTVKRDSADSSPVVRLVVRNTQLQSEANPHLLSIDIYKGKVRGMSIPEANEGQLLDLIPNLDLQRLRFDRQYRQQQLDYLRQQIFQN